MKPKRPLFLAAAWLLNSAPGCVPRDGGGDPQDQEEDIAEYDALAAKLGGSRQEFLPRTASQKNGVGNFLFWQDDPGFDPQLHRTTSDGKATIDYQIAIPEGAQYSEQLIVSVFSSEGSGVPNMVRYQAFDPGQRSAPVGDALFADPADEQRWWPFAVYESDFFVVQTDDGHALHRWSGGSTSLEFRLDDIGRQISLLWDFVVGKRHIVYVDQGGIFAVDRATRALIPVGNQTQVQLPLEAFADGILYATADGIRFFDYTTGSGRNLSEEIESSGYELNRAFATAHLPILDDPRFARFGAQVVYEANSGIFAIDLDSGQVTPILLSPRSSENDGIRTDYRDPAFTADGRMFVTGLESTSGSVGADGPIYRVDHPLFD